MSVDMHLPTSKSRLVIFLSLVLLFAAGCVSSSLPTSADPVETATAGPPTRTLPPTPSPTAAITRTPTGIPHEAWIPSTPATPPPAGFQPSPPPPPDVGSESHRSWVQAYVGLVTAMLNNNQTPEVVLNTLIGWSAPDTDMQYEFEPYIWARSVDLDGDERAEWLLSLPVPERGCSTVICPTYVVIFDRPDGLFQPRYLLRGPAPSEVQLQHPQILRVEDLNADDKPELLLQTRYCGAHTCTTSLMVGRWDGSNWHNLAADPIHQAYSELTIGDRDEDGVIEFEMHGGTYGSVGAGLQRPHTLIYDWADGAYRLITDIPDPSTHPYYLMMDANTALAKREWDRALELAMQAVNRPDFEGAMMPVEDADRRRIVTYAAVEAMLVHAQSGEVEKMEAVLEDIQRYDFMAPNLYMDAARRLLQVYRDTGDLMSACNAAEGVIARDPDRGVFFQHYGYNTERMTVDRICPLDEKSVGGSPEL